ncbi:MAG: hypothetical protein JJ891_09330 [Rhizobiaceae bacterium]|nr:hypothetical protein [Rhizobiaceae bacterium]
MINWEKWNVIVSGVASALGILVGSIGIWIGLNALEFTKKIETARLQPLVLFEDSSTDEQSITILNVSSAPAYVRSFEIRNKEGHFTTLKAWNYKAAENFFGFAGYKEQYDPQSDIHLKWLDRSSYLAPLEKYVIFSEKNFLKKALLRKESSEPGFFV